MYNPSPYEYLTHPRPLSFLKERGEKHFIPPFSFKKEKGPGDEF
jgi:hypothetical protein